MSEDVQERKAVVLAHAIREVKEIGRAVDGIMFSMSGRMTSERMKLWDKGFDVSFLQLLREVRLRVQELIEQEQNK